MRIYDRALTAAEIQTLHAGSVPEISAGPDQTIALPAAATLAGTATDDGLPNGAVTAAWSKVSGPGGVAFVAASMPATSAKSLTVDTSVIASTKLDAWWFDPRTRNATRFLSSAVNTGSLAVTTPAAGPDWVLVVDDATQGYTAPRPRHLVLTDIGGDPDDEQSMVRLMTCVNEFDIECLVASSQLGHGQSIEPQLIRDIVNAYGAVRSNLLLHASGYRTAQFLLDLVKDGHEGRVFIPAHDGYVHACELATGKLLWRALVAPNHREMVAFGQIESNWPVRDLAFFEGAICATSSRTRTLAMTTPASRARAASASLFTTRPTRSNRGSNTGTTAPSAARG